MYFAYHRNNLRVYDELYSVVGACAVVDSLKAFHYEIKAGMLMISSVLDINRVVS